MKKLLSARICHNMWRDGIYLYPDTGTNRKQSEKSQKTITKRFYRDPFAEYDAYILIKLFPYNAKNVELFVQQFRNLPASTHWRRNTRNKLKSEHYTPKLFRTHKRRDICIRGDSGVHWRPLKEPNHYASWIFTSTQQMCSVTVMHKDESINEIRYLRWKRLLIAKHTHETIV